MDTFEVILAKFDIGHMFWNWLKEGNDCWAYDDYGGSCFFCGESYPRHASDCIYVKAKKLMEAEDEQMEES